MSGKLDLYTFKNGDGHTVTLRLTAEDAKARGLTGQKAKPTPPPNKAATPANRAGRSSNRGRATRAAVQTPATGTAATDSAATDAQGDGVTSAPDATNVDPTAPADAVDTGSQD